MATDYGILYNTYYKKCINAINNLKSIHIDTRRIEKELYDINNNLEKLLKDNNLGIDIYYSKATKELMGLLVSIEEYNIYFKLDNFIKQINLKIKNIDNITIEELNDDIDNINKYLNLVKETYTRNYGNSFNIIEELYKISFKLIEIELLKKDKSTLLEILSNDDVNLQYLDTIIREKLEDIDIDNNEEIALIIYK